MENNVNICTIQLQEYFQHKLFKRVIRDSHWSKLEGFVYEDVDKALQLLSEHNTRATFFTSGWLAEKHPEVIKKISYAKHELACIGYFDYSYNDVNNETFCKDIRRSKYIIEDITGSAVIGYRAIHKPVVKNREKFLELLSAEGFLYDSSYYAPLKSFIHIPRNGKMILKDEHSGLWEIPLETLNIGYLHLPINGGNALRQFPFLVKYNFQKQQKKNQPFVLYFHPWELSNILPKVNAFDSVAKIRLYRNIGKVTKDVKDILSRGKFASISDVLGIRPSKIDIESRRDITFSLNSPKLISNYYSDKEITVIIPCYNESDTILYLKNNLNSLKQQLENQLKIKYIFVDDCSKDDTVKKLHQVFGNDNNSLIIEQHENKGVAGTIRTGLIAAKTELIASIDADCSYDPLELIPMINAMENDTAMVTASPYHKDGRVLGVPEWRLFLSRSLSRIYKGLLNHKFETYTACFRVYRKSLVMDSLNKWGDFRGILELLVRLDLAGKKLKEYPTTLHSRIFGFSKMKTISTIKKHIEFINNFSSIKKEISENSKR